MTKLPVSDMPGSARRMAVAALLLVLLYRGAMFAATGLGTIRYPFELDYGEGIVWQQMRWLFTTMAYGPIDQFPAIVFHYPPLYHAVTSVFANALGTDELATGRAVSLGSTLVAGIASAMLALSLNAREAEGTRRLSATVAGLLVFTYLPVVHWAPLMRVDMLAMALSLLGLVAAFRAIDRPNLIYAASFLFVAAVFTKQTSIAAPAATFAILLLFKPKLAIRGIVSCVLLGLPVLLALGWLTDGGFYRHIFLYNVNRPDFSRLSWVVYVAATAIIYAAVAGITLARRIADLRARHHGDRGAVRRSLGAHPDDLRLLIAVAYLAVTTLMLVLVVKSGSSINYFLEWFFALGLFVAIGVAPSGSPARASPVLAIGIPLAVAFQVAISPTAAGDADGRAARLRESAALSAQIAAADKPVISDDMVLLIRSGQHVLWEPAIFAELASTGAWDERPFVRRIRNREFAFFITWGQRGHHRFDERYNPAVADAIDSAYPLKDTAAGLTIHRPRPL